MRKLKTERLWHLQSGIEKRMQPGLKSRTFRLPKLLSHQPVKTKQKKKKSNHCFLFDLESSLKWKGWEKRMQMSQTDLSAMARKASRKLGKDPAIFFSVCITESSTGSCEAPILLLSLVMQLDYHRQGRWLLNPKDTEIWGEILVSL